MKINLDKELKKGNKVFSGRSKGEKVRTKYSLDKIDNSQEKIKVIFPEDTFSLNASFFLGMFGKSIRHLGKGAFKDKYKFECNEIIHKSIEDGINRALKSSNVLKE